MSQENIELLRRANEALNDGDLDAFLALCDAEVVASPRLASIEGVYRGRDGVRLWWESLRGAFPDFHSEVVAVRDFGNVTLAEVHNRGRGVEGETPVEQRSWAVHEWQAGRCIRWTVYGSEAEALKAVGLEEEAMSQENVELVKQGFEHFIATGEVPWDAFDEDVEIHDHDTPDQGDYRGHAGYARWLEDWGAAWAEWTMEIERYIDAGDSVVTFFLMRTSGRGSGIEVTREDAIVYWVRNGKIVRGDYYNDRKEALKAVGLEE